MVSAECPPASSASYCVLLIGTKAEPTLTGKRFENLGDSLEITSSFITMEPWPGQRSKTCWKVLFPPLSRVRLRRVDHVRGGTSRVLARLLNTRRKKIN